LSEGCLLSFFKFTFGGLRWVLTTYSLLLKRALPKTVGLIGVMRMLDEFCFLVLIDLLAKVLNTEFWKLFFNSCSVGDYG
jgi:hypothetical protein